MANLPSTSSFIASAATTSNLLQSLISKPNLFGDLDLIIAHDLHALDPVYELLVSRLRWTNPETRVIGSSASVLDASDLAEWLGVPEHATYSFSPSARSSSLTNSLQPFSGPHSASLLRTMVKPAYAAMRLAAGSTICFVPSRAQCRSTARDLVTQTAADSDDSFVAGSRSTIDLYAQSIQDPELAEALTHGIAVYHEGLKPEEQTLAIELFRSGTVRILIASREACWNLSVKASLVILMSCQFATLKGDIKDNEREIQDYQLPEILQMQSLAIPPRADTSAECLILCQKDQGELYLRFLDKGVVVESELSATTGSLLPSVIFNDLLAGRIKSRQDVVDSLSWTYLSWRIKSNPSYYARREEKNLQDDRLARFADDILDVLESSCCLLYKGNEDIELSAIGRVVGRIGSTPSKVVELQQIELEELMKLSEPSKVSEKASEQAEEQDLDAITFLARLSRITRDKIGNGEGLSKEQSLRRILLGSFSAGRIPRAVKRLEDEQALLVGKLLKSKPLK